jgi:thiol-disulfide isomerase/thioredoxin
MIKKLSIVLAFILLLSSLTSCAMISDLKKPKLLPKDKEGYVEFYQSIKSGRVVVAKFGLDICQGCIEANKTLISIMPTYDKAIYFSKVDLMKDREAEKNYKIKMMPTIIFFDKDGKEFFRLEGTVTKKLIVDKIESFCWNY